MRDIRDAILALDNSFLINKFNAAAEHSPDDEFIQVLLKEIINRQLTIEEVLAQRELH
ncbi:sporulation histidine kinase inhibitor Sda [Cohnella sp.]|uniref:sporulation histidine kinase inhibitor Sda n=1 Tax=Cohnella sp. TaxID=1883426 RepID=UPI0035630435